MGFQHVTTLKAAFLAISIYDKIDVRNTYALHGILYRLSVLSLKKTKLAKSKNSIYILNIQIDSMTFPLFLNYDIITSFSFPLT